MDARTGTNSTAPLATFCFPSVFKLVLAVAALEEADLEYKPTDRYPCNYTFRETKWKCSARYGHVPGRQVGLSDAIKFSCNNYFYELGLASLGKERIERWAEHLGYGKHTGLEVRDATGFLASTVDGLDICNYSIGQQYVKASALQVARSICWPSPPTMIVSSGPSLPLDAAPTFDPLPIRRAETRAAIREGMWRVVPLNWRHAFEARAGRHGRRLPSRGKDRHGRYESAGWAEPLVGGRVRPRLRAGRKSTIGAHRVCDLDRGDQGAPAAKRAAPSPRHCWSILQSTTHRICLRRWPHSEARRGPRRSPWTAVFARPRSDRAHGTRCALCAFDEDPHRALSGPARARGQIVKAIVGVVAFLIVARIDYRVMARNAYLIYGGLIAVLTIMIVVKFASGGLLRFINVYFFHVQPSELMKIALVLGLARYLRYRQDQQYAHGLIAPLLLTVVPMALVLLQPDLGTSLMFPPVLLGMLFVAGRQAAHSDRCARCRSQCFADRVLRV